MAKTAKAIAEIAKTERGREKCTSVELVRALVALLKEKDIDVLTQTSRALGNICYENGTIPTSVYKFILHNFMLYHFTLLLLFSTTENGKKLVREEDGLKVILTVLKNGVALKNSEGASFLRNVAAGFLLNFLVDQESLHKKVRKLHCFIYTYRIMTDDS